MPEFGFETKIEVLVSNSMVRAIIDDMLEVMSTGYALDGKKFV